DESDIPQNVSGSLNKQGMSNAQNNTQHKPKTVIYSENGDVKIQAAQNFYHTEEERTVKKSGLLGTGGIGFTIGQQKTKTESDNTALIHSSSMVGSLGGDTQIYAGKNYSQVGSTVSSVGGETTISADKVDIVAAQNRNEDKYKQTFEQKGLTIALNVPVITAAQSVAQGIKQQGKSGNSRVNALNAANTILDANKLAGSATGTYNAAKGLMQNGLNAKSLTNAAQGSGISVSITYGQQKNQSESQMITTQASASQVKGTNTAVIARNGAMNIIGSDVYGLDSTYLQAAKDVNIQAFRETETERSSNKSFGWNAGVAITFDNGFSAGITGGANYGKGHGNGDGVSWRNSHIGSDTGATQIVSGETVNIKGGQVSGKGVDITAKDLNIESLQDTYTYDGKQENMSAQVTVGWGGAAVGGSYDKSKSSVDYAVVNEQSGIFAGEDGYQINLGDGVIHSKGGAIVSTASPDKNLINAADYQFENIENHSNVKASSIGLAGATSVKWADALSQDPFDEKRRIGDKNSGISSKEATQIAKDNEKYRAGNPDNATYEQATPNKNNLPIRFGLNTDDIHSTDKYALAKLGAANLLGNSKESESRSNTTYAVVSDGVHNIGSQSGKENIAKSVANSGLPEYQALEKINKDELLEEVELNKKVQKKFIGNAAEIADSAYKSQFIDQHRMMTFRTNPDGTPMEDPEIIAQMKKDAKAAGIDFETYKQEQIGKGANIYQLREVTDQERLALREIEFTDPNNGQDRTVKFVAFNGIFNSINNAATNAVQEYVAKYNPDTEQIDKRIYQNIYFVHNPTANSKLGELAVAGYQKFLEGNFGLSLGNSTVQAKNLLQTYGQDNLYVGSHSRGTLTVANALKSLDTEENRKNKILSGTNMKMVGPAANVSNSDTRLSQLQGFGETRTTEDAKSRAIRFESHNGDLVSRIVGMNPATTDTNEKDKNILQQWKDIFGDYSSPHNCYGLGKGRCVEDGYRKKDDLYMHPEKTLYNLNKGGE
ncbi:MAG: hemagglutinin repeat-containing protein, partial [Neisseriaceae bacterium]|nr:hemagglutinin repeat-containing protein [Neisseriaceae bacterium]